MLPRLFITLAAALIAVTGDVEGVHDPAIIRAGGAWYVFSTGFAQPGIIPIRRSTDLHTWTRVGHVFDRLPEWATREISGARGAWAPDISEYNGSYRLYYAVSTFGHNDSAIGLATNRTLDPASPDYKWTDAGMVIRSHAGQDDWNAIDPNLATGGHGEQWLVFGSFWGGIKMRRIDPATGLLDGSDSRLYSLAERPHSPGHPDAIEAPFVVHRGRFYYLFVSFDFCCRGVNSTYKVAVGRSRAITGPYVDEAGTSMLEGGGTVLERGTPLWKGPGHEAVLLERPKDLLVFHAYDGRTGRPYLKISTMEWRDGWPRVAGLPGVGR